jgi:hypothetical protein
MPPGQVSKNVKMEGNLEVSCICYDSWAGVQQH